MNKPQNRNTSLACGNRSSRKTQFACGKCRSRSTTSSAAATAAAVGINTVTNACVSRLT